MMVLLRKIYWTVRHFLQDHFPRYFVDRGWLKWKGYKVDWNNPRDINEKMVFGKGLKILILSHFQTGS